MPSYQHGRHTVLTVAGDTVKANTSSLTRGRESHKTSGYGDEDHTKDPGMGENTFSMGGVYDKTAETGSRAILQPLSDAGEKVVVTRKPEGTGSGKPLETFTAVITSYVETSPVADMVTWTCDMDIDGGIVTTTQGA
jgi:hypothetical protein